MTEKLIALAMLCGVLYLCAALVHMRRTVAAQRLTIAALDRHIEELQVAAAQRTLADRQRRSQAGVKGWNTKRQRKLGLPLPLGESKEGGAK